MHTTKYQKSITVVSPTSTVLKPINYNTKLSKKGKFIKKGKWKGMAAYSLTLVERETCPTYCHHWTTCYGNHMPFAERFKHGRKLTAKLNLELEQLAQQYPNGFAVRLHILGDFYSLAYVKFWENMMKLYPMLHVWGYTGLHSKDPIGAKVQSIRTKYPARWWVRISRNRGYNNGALYAATEDFDGDGFVYPEPSGDVEDCANCGACWISLKTVIFPTH